jgi:EmrB/QacA subfamily drug resistance transporter
LSATSSETGRAAAPSSAGTGAAITSGAGSGPNRLGLALAVIATAQLMVVLDATIVNVALSHIQRALGFSGTGLEWIITAYSLTFGGLLLLGGRLGDLLGRRRVFIAGIILFSVASLAGGFATSQAWLLTARAIQGVGGAIIAPTALSLITTTFPEGPPRNRAMGVYAAMAGGGGAVGLLAGGLLTSYVSWRWVLFVNVPIGIAVALASPFVFPESPRRTGRFDIPGAITGTGGVALLVYGLTQAAASSDGVSHWGNGNVMAALIGSVVLLAAFTFIEIRSKHALMPIRVLRDRNRAGAYLISLCIGTALFGMFFFLTVFMQDVWGYSALRTGVAYLPLAVGIVVAAGFSSQLVARIGARPLMLTGTPLAVAGLFWLTRITEHSHYTTDLLGPMVLMAIGLGLVFVPLTLIAVSGVPEQDSGVASSLVNTGQQVGGSVGLAALGTVAWSTFAGNIHAAAAHAASAAAAAAKAGHAVHLSAAQTAALQQTMYKHALAVGFARGFLIAAGVMLLALIIALAAIRVRRSDLAGDQAMIAA